MQVTNAEEETLSTLARGRREGEGDGEASESVAHRAPGLWDSPPASEPVPFELHEAGNLALKELELVRVVNRRALGKYRVQQVGVGEDGLVFLVSLFGATCSKVEMLIGRKLEWRDYLRATKHAIERELGYWRNRGEPLSSSVPRAIDVTVRDTDLRLS